LAVLGWTKSRV